MHIIKRRNVLYLATCAIVLAIVFFVSNNEFPLVAAERQESSQQQQDKSKSPTTGPLSTGLSSYLSSARNLLTNGLEAHESAQTYSTLRPNDNPQTDRMLRDTVDKTSVLIDDYQHEGLANLPALPNLPGLSTLMRIPDKLLRAELVMLQDGIRMAQEMRTRPITATMNTPKERSEN